MFTACGYVFNQRFSCCAASLSSMPAPADLAVVAHLEDQRGDMLGL